MLLRTIAAILLALTPVFARAAPPMLVATSPHFTIYAAQNEADLRRFAENLESYDAVLRRLTGGRADDADIIPLTIYMRADQMAVEAGWGTLGYYMPSAAGTFAVVPAKVRGIQLESVPRIVLFHEYAHHFILQNFPALYSPWFVEGSAEFYSTVEFEGGKALIGKPEPLRVSTLMGNQRATLKYLLSPGKKGLTPQQTAELYARSWLLVHYLTLSKQRAGQIDGYLRARGKGASEDQAFQTAFGTSISAMDAELKRYFAPRSLSYATIDLPRGGAVSIRTASGGEIALTRLVPELRNLQRRKDALTAYKSSVSARQSVELYSDRLAADARSAARKMPQDAALQEILAECLLLAGKVDEARAAADAAVTLKPRSARAHLVLARIARATLSPGDAAALTAMRSRVVVANRAAPNDPLPLVDYYQSYAEHGLKPPPRAIDGLARAHQLAPQDDGVAMLLAKAEIEAGQPARAAELLRPIAFAPHGGPRRDAAQALLKTLAVAQEDAPPAVAGVAASAAPPDE